MTIIINAGSTLVADRAKAVENHTFAGNKVHDRDHFAWAMAGTNPSRAMLNADSVESLVATFKMEVASHLDDVLVILTEPGQAEQYWVDASREHVLTVVANVLEPFCGVGCYRSEWARYRTSRKEENPFIVAQDFIDLVERLNGLPPPLTDFLVVG